jgi:hypothetical protein
MPAKKKNKVNKSLLGAIGAATLGVIAGVTAVFLSKEENRDKVKRAVDSGVRKGKVGIAKAKKEVKKLGAKGKKALKKMR